MVLRYRAALVAAWVVVSGCSSKKASDDMDDVDAGGMDAGPALDAGPADRDAGPVPEADAGPSVDAHVPADSGPEPDPEPDAGAMAMPDAGPGAICMVDGDCAETGFCDRRYNFCLDRGRCAVRPTDCTGVASDPVCGCDGVTYTNDCERQLAGVATDYRGACDAPGPCPDITPRNCCYDDEDCSARGYPPLPFTRRCFVADACGGGELGRCLEVPRTGRCWVDGDCAPGQTCEGEFFYLCGETGTDPIVMGTCT